MEAHRSFSSPLSIFTHTCMGFGSFSNPTQVPFIHKSFLPHIPPCRPLPAYFFTSTILLLSCHYVSSCVLGAGCIYYPQGAQSAPLSGKSCPFPPSRLLGFMMVKDVFCMSSYSQSRAGALALRCLLSKCCWMNAWRRFLWCCTLVDVGALVFNNTVIVHVFYKASFMGLTEGYCSCYSVFCSLWVLCYFWRVHCCWCPAFGRDTGLLFTCCFLFFMDTQLDSISQPHLQLGMTIWLILPSGMWAEIVSLLNPAHKISHVPSSPPSSVSWILVPQVTRCCRWYSLCSLCPWVELLLFLSYDHWTLYEQEKKISNV